MDSRMSSFIAYVRANWKTNLAAFVLVVYSAPSFVAAVEAWQNHQPANWRAGIIGLIVAAGLAGAKDGTNHSTVAQVEKATEKAAEKTI